jgi:hypothetical protein
MTWFAILQMAMELIRVIVPIIGHAMRHGGEEADVTVLPESVKQCVVTLARQVESAPTPKKPA